MRLGRRLSAFLLVIPGHRAAMNPEPMNTDLEKCVPRPATTSEETVFMGSGFGPAGRPGMTKVVSSQTPRSPRSERLEGRTAAPRTR